MSPIIQATIALNFSTLVGVVFGYYLRTLTHRCARRPPLLRVPAGSRARLELEGDCELGEGAIENNGEIVIQGGSLELLEPPERP